MAGSSARYEVSRCGPGTSKRTIFERSGNGCAEVRHTRHGASSVICDRSVLAYAERIDVGIMCFPRVLLNGVFQGV